MAYTKRLDSQDETRSYLTVSAHRPNNFIPGERAQTNFNTEVLSDIKFWSTDRTIITATAEPANKRVVLVRVVEVHFGIVLEGKYAGSSYLRVGIDENYIHDSSENTNRATRHIQIYAEQVGTELAFRDMKKLFELGINDKDKGFLVRLTLAKEVSGRQTDGYNYYHILGNHMILTLPSEVWNKYNQYMQETALQSMPGFTTAAELLRKKKEAV